ncbi:MAG: hypothetical protein Q4C85_07120 [Actinomyces sp.]|uniref:hypothetical protein n=1 Tax=Actinomyces sp. TaxID=29317 RepID=UPI0026DC9145|nr:hypothetical protein [Actinomyces sp.]MDO4243513.1 hypothetical protein [Actinomyces sp.]
MSQQTITAAALTGHATGSEATAVEQTRAVAEVQAAITVARACPRDLERARAEMQRSCAERALADRAFYAVKGLGSGPSIHLARELARIWGNIDYGVREMRRDDVEGVSEVQAYAWDQETNARTIRSFIVPHARTTRQGRQRLTDLGDIYRHNQNQGAKAVRECILAVLPTWLVQEAQDLCHATLRGQVVADGLDKAIEKSLAAFARLGVTQAMLEARVGRPRTAWSADDVARLRTDYTSLTRDGVPVAELFEPHTVDAAALAGPVGAPPELDLVEPGPDR